MSAAFCFIVGLILRITDAMDWLHEWFHQVTGTALGYHVVARGLSYTTWREHEVSVAVHAAGYLGEALFYTMVGTLLACTPLWPVSGFCLAALCVVAYVTPGSVDMANSGLYVTFGIEAVATVGIITIISLIAKKWRNEWKEDSCSTLRQG